MKDARLKLGLVVASLFVVGSALFWNGLYRGAASDSGRFEDSERLVLLVNGGDAPLRPLAAVRAESRRRAPVVPPRRGSVDAPPGPATVSVRKGDSLYRIADHALGDGDRWIELARLNDLSPPYVIRPGQVLRLPSGR